MTRVVRNDWSLLRVPELGRWEPTLRVSVVIPAYNCQPSLDLTLASLSRQTYPAQLLEVVVVDDGSEPALELPKVRPENARLVRVRDHSDGWGIANACHVGVSQSTGEVIQRLDADMLVFPAHVEAHARWHHQVPYAVTLGDKRFVDVRPGSAGWPTPDEVAHAADSDRVDGLFDVDSTEPHGYIDRMVRRTDELRSADHLVFLAHVGATVAMRRELYEAAGGFNPALRRGSDTEFGYRLAQAGGLFLPEHRARSWHLGRSNVMRDAEPIQRYSRAFLADLMPHPRWLRKVGGTGWAVPLVEVVIDVAGHPLEVVRASVDAVLANDETDLRVCLVGPWDSMGREPRSVLDDSALELRLVAATYRSDPRVRFVARAPESAFPSPYLLAVPVTCGLAATAIRRLVDVADQHRLGLVRVALPGGTDGSVDLWRTAALGRASWVRRGDEPLDGVVAEVYGTRTLSAEAVGVVNLSTVPVERLAEGLGQSTVGGGGRWLPGSVEVAGVRSLVRATVVVARLSGTRAWARARRLLAGGRRRIGGEGGQ